MRSPTPPRVSSRRWFTGNASPPSRRRARRMRAEWRGKMSAPMRIKPAGRQPIISRPHRPSRRRQRLQLAQWPQPAQSLSNATSDSTATHQRLAQSKQLKRREIECAAWRQPHNCTARIWRRPATFRTSAPMVHYRRSASEHAGYGGSATRRNHLRRSANGTMRGISGPTIVAAPISC